MVFRKVLYFIMCIVALTIYTLQRLQVSLPFLVNNYGNDLLYLPLVLGAIEFLIRRLKRESSFKLSLGFVIFLACAYSIYFEYYLPKVNTRYTADCVDVILYFVGGIGYFFIGNKRKHTVLEEEF